jgi:hypothetical protein
MADKLTKICMDIYWKLEKSGVLNLQIPDILEICCLYNLLREYVKIYIIISRHQCFCLYHLSLIVYE